MKSQLSLRRLVSKLAALGAAMILVAVAKPAAADDAAAQARELMRRGDEAITAGRFAEAESAYEKAFELKPGFDVAANLADAERKLGKHHEAARHYAYAVRTYPASFDPEMKRALQDALGEMQAKVGTVHVTVSQPGAAVSADGQAAGTSPLAGPLFLDPGSHVLEARTDQLAARAELTVAAGDRREVELQLAGEGPGDGGAEAPRSAVPGVVLGALGAAGVGIGIGLVVHGGALGNEADEFARTILADGGRCGTAQISGFEDRCAEADGVAGDSERFVGGGWVSIGVGAALLGAAAAYLLWPDNAPNQDITLLPSVAPGATGVVLTGSF